MPGRRIPQNDSMGSVLLQPADAPGVGLHSTPKWSLQGKQRNEHDFFMAEKSALKAGWGAFYDETDRVDKIGDTTRRHVTRGETKEVQWRPCFKPGKVDLPPPRAFGKRAVEPMAMERHLQETSDIPHGKKRVPPPVSHLAEEMAMFQLKHTVRDPVTGGRVADKVADPNAKEPPRGMKKVFDPRNGIGVAVAGDKGYSAVEYANEYLAALNPMRPKNGVEKILPPVKIVDKWAVKEEAFARTRDVAEVRSLPKY